MKTNKKGKKKKAKTMQLKSEHDAKKDTECPAVSKDLMDQLESLNRNGDSWEEQKDSGGLINQFMKEYVHNVYERIAVHFSHTRYRPWPGVVNFLDDLDEGSLVLDVGCGNGKYAFCNKKIMWMGLDRSVNLLDPKVTYNSLHGSCQGSRGCLEVHVGDCLSLNVRSDVVDASLCIAVLHHLPTEAQRIQALMELIRCTRKGGKILLYVWASEQTPGSVGARKFNSQDVFVAWKLQKHLDPVYKEEQSEPEIQEDQRGLTTLYRYYHLFKFTEIHALLSHVKSKISLLSLEFESNNWRIILEKN